MARRGVTIILGVMALAVAAGCSSESEECLREFEGNLFFTFDPQLPSPSDSLMNIKLDIPDALLTDISPFPNNVPPVIFYRFSTPTYPRLDLRLDDLGSDLPLEVDSTYTLTVDLTQRLTPAAMGLKIFDRQGLLYLGVQDFRPSGDPLASIFEDGYGNLNDSGELQVFFGDTGCAPRVENTACFLEITNYRLDFLLDGGRSLGLYNGDEGTMAGWIFHVHKSSKVIGKQGCPLSLLEQNAVSFFVQRESAG